MALKKLPLIPLFERFIKESYNGKRLKTDGTRIRKQTTDNYYFVLCHLKEFELSLDEPLRIQIYSGTNKRIITAEKNHWKKFYLDFTRFMYQEKNCYDNYVGSVIKIIRGFFNYLKKEKSLPIGDYHKNFYVCKEDIPIITLLPDQLQFLINDTKFESGLSNSLKKTKDIIVFGCTVALRVSDIFAIKFSDIEFVGSSYYLPIKTIKTNTVIRVKLPDYCIDIINRFREKCKGRKTVFPPIPKNRFNKQFKFIGELAGWTSVVGKKRSKRGVEVETFLPDTKQQYRFCDLLSSHTMRRTAITTMLMLGMKEHVVKKISGHAANSKSFYRYVNLVQSYLDNEMDLVFNKLTEVA